jgi:hypothetical protein
MVGLSIDIDFDDFLTEVDDEIEQLRIENASLFQAEGQEAVDYAIANGAYKNRTGKLRASNRSGVIEDENITLELENTADYASFVEAKGFDVLTGALLNAEDRLKPHFE